MKNNTLSDITSKTEFNFTCDDSAYSDAYRIINTILLIGSGVFGIVANLITAIALLHARRKSTGKRSPLRTSLTSLIINLCFCDCFYWIIETGFTYDSYQQKGWLKGETECFIYGFLRHIPQYGSFYTIAAIAINRALAIYHPNVSSMIFDVGKTLPVIFVIWTIPIALEVPLLIPSLGYGYFGYSHKECQCGPIAEGPVDLVELTAYISNILPWLIMLISFILILIHLRSSWNRVRSISTHMDDQFCKRETRLSIMVVCMIVLYFVSVTPLLIVFYAQLDDGEIGDTITTSLYSLNFFGNLFFYIYKNKCYREAFVLFFKDIGEFLTSHKYCKGDEEHHAENENAGHRFRSTFSTYA